MKRNERKKGLLLGVGLDNDDGHKRITHAADFFIAGGSEETHERMTETAIKTVEDLGNQGKTLGDVDPRELKDIIHKHTSSA